MSISPAVIQPRVLPEQAVILLADDGEDDVILVRRALTRANVLNPLFIVRDGEEAIAYLDGAGKYSNREEYPLPGIILLDIKMPKILMKPLEFENYAAFMRSLSAFWLHQSATSPAPGHLNQNKETAAASKPKAPGNDEAADRSPPPATGRALALVKRNAYASTS